MNQGKLEVVKQEMNRMKINVLDISELKWAGSGYFDSGDYKIFYCGNNTTRRNGVALILEKKITRAVIAHHLKNERMMSIRFQGTPMNSTIIQVYAPTTDAEEETIEIFYADLQQLIDETPKKDAILLIGDWNAKVGNKEEPGVAGKFGLGNRNAAVDRRI